ncbi:rh168.1 [macacine betaherpesvirus 3]|uniref:Rh168.1 n=1 Tax=Rhesus cytomegalovirus (strain 68-1) TaxID=47929 RepID=Q2FAD5_RHCM6|nr:rh168.1 [macacine betaherpesvirus 3]
MLLWRMTALAVNLTWTACAVHVNHMLLKLVRCSPCMPRQAVVCNLHSIPCYLLKSVSHGTGKIISIYDTCHNNRVAETYDFHIDGRFQGSGKHDTVQNISESRVNQRCELVLELLQIHRTGFLRWYAGHIYMYFDVRMFRSGS